MKPIICFGEALIDFLNFSSEKQDKLSLNNFRQYPGGAPANAAVAAAKLGGKAYFSGQVGQDAFGDFLLGAMKAYGVDVRYSYQHPTAQTALAFVTLDEDGERSFTFYRQNSADVLMRPEQIKDSWFHTPSIFHFCSNTLTEKAIRECTESAVKKASNQGTIISFDVNLRHNLWPNNEADAKVVNLLVRQAHILKFAQEEFDYLAQGDQDAFLQECLAQQCELLIITNGNQPLKYYTKQGQYEHQPPTIKMVDSTAGGDGFVGGLLFALSHFESIEKALLSPEQLKQIIAFASCCGALAVSRPGAFPALPNTNEARDYFAQQEHSHQLIPRLFSPVNNDLETAPKND